jgi:hypothetical protein
MCEKCEVPQPVNCAWLLNYSPLPKRMHLTCMVWVQSITAMTMVGRNPRFIKNMSLHVCMTSLHTLLFVTCFVSANSKVKFTHICVNIKHYRK